MPNLLARRTPSVGAPHRVGLLGAPILLALVFASLAAPEARSQGAFIYALTEGGNLSVNATLRRNVAAVASVSRVAGPGWLVRLCR